MNDEWTIALAFVSLLGIALGLLVLAWQHRRLGLASMLLLVLAVVVWGFDVAAITTGFEDADGFVDCRDDCTFVHRLAVLGFITPPLLVSVAAAGMTIALVSRARARRAGVGENRS